MLYVQMTEVCYRMRSLDDEAMVYLWVFEWLSVYCPLNRVVFASGKRVVLDRDCVAARSRPLYIVPPSCLIHFVEMTVKRAETRRHNNQSLLASRRPV